MSSHTQTFTATGTFTAPTEMLNGSVSVDVRGAAGAASTGKARNHGQGGAGARVQGSVPVAAGGTLHITIGYHAGGAGGSGETDTLWTTPDTGGAGGGSAAVLTSATVLLVEAAGGGGGGGGYYGTLTAPRGGSGGAGGHTGSAGAAGNKNTSATNPGSTVTYGQGGSGATASAGGAGGAGGTRTTSTYAKGGPGTSGTSSGGAGGHPVEVGPGGGGGGGGYFGGGGGGSAPTDESSPLGHSAPAGSAGGGGGGSSYASSSVTSPTYTSGYNSGAATVIVTYVTADAPNVPTLVAPANGSHASASPLKFVYNPAANSGALYKWAARRKTGTTAFTYWTATSADWVDDVVELATDLLTYVDGTEWEYTFPEDSWVTGDTYSYSVATWESSFGLGGTFASTASFTNATTTKVTFTGPTTPVGTATPTVSWTSSAEQTSYHGKLFTKATTEEDGFTVALSGTWLYDTGTVTSSDTSFAVPASAGVTQGTYVVYVMVTSGGTASAWHSHAFEVEFTPTPTPSLAANRTETSTSKMPVVVLALSVEGWTKTKFPALTAEVECSDDTGATWTDLYDGTVSVTTDTEQAHVTDYSCPNGVTRKYRARTYATHDGVPVSSVWCDTVTGPVLPNARWWIVDVTDPTSAIGLARGQSMTTTFYGTTSGQPSYVETRNVSGGMFTCLGRDTYVKVTDVPLLPEFDLIMDFFGQEEFDAFMDLWLANQGTAKTMLVKSDQAGTVYWCTFGLTRPSVVLRAADRVTNPIRQVTVHCYPATPVV